MKIVYIDVQNTHQRTVERWWLIDWARFFIYLKEKYKVDIIYYAVGYIPKHQDLYEYLQSVWYTLLYKKTLILPDGTIKWNVDIDIAIQSIFDLTSWKLTQVYLVTNDGDYNTLVRTFIDHNVFAWLIAPDASNISKLLTRLVKDIIDLQRIKHIIQKQKDSPDGESF